MCLRQIWQQRGVHVVHERLCGARVEQHAALPAGDLPPRQPVSHGRLRRLHRPGQRAVHTPHTAYRAGPGTHICIHI